MAPPEWRPLLNGIRPHRRPAAAACYAIAGLQREHAERRLSEWPVPESTDSIELDVLTLACERDRVILFRMITSFLEHVGAPRSITVVSDGSLTPDTISALGRLTPRLRVRETRELLEAEWVPDVVSRLASNHVLGAKLALGMTAPTDVPLLQVDSDVEFLSGGRRLSDVVEDLGDRPRFMQHEPVIRGVGTPNTYDPRLLCGRHVLPRVNSGVVLWRQALSWESALERLEYAADDPLPLTEQTAHAIALTDSGGVPLPPDDFILTTEDGGRPWDRFARKDVVLRHYFSIGLQWKMAIKGGPRGPRTIPAAIAGGVWRRVLGRTPWRWVH